MICLLIRGGVNFLFPTPVGGSNPTGPYLILFSNTVRLIPPPPHYFLYKKIMGEGYLCLRAKLGITPKLFLHTFFKPDTKMINL